MDETLPADEAPQCISTVGSEWVAQKVGVGGRYAVERRRVKVLAIIPLEHPVRCLAQVRRFIEHGVEHWCEIAG